MELLQNLHTHSTFCDGKHTPAEMVRFAQQKGFTSLGFSGHCAMWYSPYSTITEQSTEAYKREIAALKEEYKDTFPIFLGLEVDMYAGVDLSGYDYLIGSVHYLKCGDGYPGFDRDAQVVQQVIREHFGGDGMAFVKAYYETMAQLPQYGTFDILAHPDLITKNCDTVNLFDENDPRYLRYATEAIDALAGHIPLFEVNTGAMARGYRKTPYPSPELMRVFREYGFGAVISSDCHDGEQMDCGFEDSRLLLKAAGFKERYILTASGFEAVAL